MRRRLFTFCSALSLLLFVGTCVFWLRSYRYAEHLYYEAGTYANSDQFGAMHWHGVVQLERLRHGSKLAGPNEFGSGRWVGDRYAFSAGADSGDYVVACRIMKDGANGCPREPTRTFLNIGFGGEQIARQGFRDMRRPPPPPVSSTFIHVPHCWFAILTALLPVTWLARRTRDGRKRRKNAYCSCPTCGYDLRASPDRCPECGRPAEAVGA